MDKQSIIQMSSIQRRANIFSVSGEIKMVKQSEKSMHFLAKQAKGRMTSGYYGSAARRGESGRTLKQTFEDKLMFEKIAAMVKSGTDAHDAIGRLVDKKLIETADEITKQRHVLQIAANYVKVRRELSRQKTVL